MPHYFFRKPVRQISKPMEIVIVGNSLVLAGLAAGLKNKEELRLTQLDLPMIAAIAEMRLIGPDAIIFDMNSDNVSGIGAVLQRFLGAKLIGLLAGDASMVVITGNEQKVQSIGDLAEVIMG